MGFYGASSVGARLFGSLHQRPNPCNLDGVRFNNGNLLAADKSKVRH